MQNEILKVLMDAFLQRFLHSLCLNNKFLPRNYEFGLHNEIKLTKVKFRLYNES